MKGVKLLNVFRRVKRWESEKGGSGFVGEEEGSLWGIRARRPAPFTCIDPERASDSTESTEREKVK
jgi:hypothetical protein